MPVNHYTELGEQNDALKLWIDHKPISNYIQYNFTRSILRQPSTFSFTVGNGGLARDLLHSLPPRAMVNLTIGETTVFTGMLEDPVFDSSDGATQIVFQGRDLIAPLTKHSILDERKFEHPTYLDFTKAIVRMCGFADPEGNRKPSDWTLAERDNKLPPVSVIAGNEANRTVSTRVSTKKVPYKQMIAELETGLVARDGGKIKYQAPHGQIGQSLFEFLSTQYKKIGLYLWCGADGNLILSRPTGNMPPIYEIIHRRGQLRTENSAYLPKMTNRTSARHTYVRVYGKGRPDKNGHIAISGDFIDQEMFDMGFRDVLTIHDSDCKTLQDCQYRAKRHIAEEIRGNRTIVYPVAGHTTPSLVDRNKMAIWAPDTVVHVTEDEMAWWSPSVIRADVHDGRIDNVTYSAAIDEDMYIETVEMIRDANGTRTNLHLMRQSDLYYLGETTEIGDEYAKRREVTTAALLAELAGYAP